ncbi:MAG: hypothetical protein WBL39_07590 [Terrimicrobiaceae bacterium]
MILLTRRSSVAFRLAVLLVLMLDSRAQGQPLTGTASVQIVNATSVPAIALRINDRLAYETFPQGLKSADSPTSMLKATYEAEDKQTGRFAKSAEINYKPGTNQSLVILGDFSIGPPAGTLRRPGHALVGNGEQYPPSILFQVFSHAAQEAPVRVRIINGMPGKSLTFITGRDEIVVEPGNFAVLNREPAVAHYQAKTDGEEISVLMRQEGLVRNAMIIFFLKNGRPGFMRAFENNADSNRRASELAKEKE